MRKQLAAQDQKLQYVYHKIINLYNNNRIEKWNDLVHNFLEISKLSIDVRLYYESFKNFAITLVNI